MVPDKNFFQTQISDTDCDSDVTLVRGDDHWLAAHKWYHSSQSEKMENIMSKRTTNQVNYLESNSEDEVENEMSIIAEEMVKEVIDSRSSN